MGRLQYYCSIAPSNPVEAARKFLEETSSEDLVRTLISIAQWRDDQVEDFERRGGAVLIDGRFGRFWFASSELKSSLLPPAPRISPRGLVALSRGLTEVLMEV